MKIMVHPRDSNPYQSSLYGEMAAAGHKSRYVGHATASASVNMALLPLEMIILRALGYRHLHIHWLYRFSLRPISSMRLGRALMQCWLAVVLWVARAARLKVVWIAHNVLPHTPIFNDDVAARRMLLAALDVLVVHDESVVHQLSKMGQLPATRVIARHPAYDSATATPLRVDAEEPLRLLFFGKIARYKDVPQLLSALSAVREPMSLTIAGSCDDSELREMVEEMSRSLSQQVVLRIEHIPEDELATLVAQSHLVVLPFATVTTSGSAMYALSSARAVLMPDAPSLRGFPENTVFRYRTDGAAVLDLARALDEAARNRCAVSAKGRAARQWSTEYSWRDLAANICGSDAAELAAVDT